jgi:membrane fusion protein
MADALFRTEVIEARRHRLAGTVIAAVPPSSRLYTWIVATVAVIALAVLLFASYASTANVRGVVAYDAGIARVTSNVSGDVRALLVKPGAEVAAGAALIALSTAQGTRGLATQLAQVDSQIGEIDRQVTLAATTEATDEQALRQQRAALIDSVASLSRQRSIADSQIRLGTQGVGRYVRLARQGAGTQRQVDDARSDLLSHRAAQESLGERLIDARGKIAAIGIQLEQRRLEGDKARSLLLAQRAALIGQREDLQRADHIVIAAPVSGNVSDISAEIGQHVLPNGSLATIVPRGSRIETWLYAPSNAIGFVQPGQRVRLRFDAYPYQKYGWGSGTVLAISRSAIDPANVDVAIRPAEPAFRVRVSIDSMGAIPMPRDSLRPGMTVSADLVLRHRPLWALLFGSFAGIVD